MTSTDRAGADRLVASMVLTGLGLVAAVVGAGYGVLGDDSQVGPGFMPVLAGGLMVLFGLLDLGVGLRTRPRGRDSAAAGSSEETVADSSPRDDSDVDLLGRTSRQRKRQLWVVFALVLGSLLVVSVLGFLLAFGLLVFVCSYAVERQRLLPSALVSTLSIVAVHAIFVLFLGVPLPTGVLGIL